VIKLTIEQKISFLKILFSFTNMDGTFSDNEESAITMLINKVFKIDIKDSEYRIFIKNIDELLIEFEKLDFNTQKIVFQILEEILDKNKYDDSKFYKKSKKEKEANELLLALKKELKCC